MTLSIADAAVDASRWPAFLASYARVVGADIALLQEHFFGDHRSHLFATFGMGQPFTDSYNQHYSRINVWRERGSEAYVLGRVFFDREIYPRALLRRTEFYNDYLRPNGGTQSLAVVADRPTGQALMLTALRSDSAAPFGEVDKSAARTLGPHVRHARDVHCRLTKLAATEAALNSVTVAVLFLGRDRRIVFLNGAAEGMARQNDGLTIRDRSLTVGDANARAAVARAIDVALQPGTTLAPPAPVLVPRPSMRRPFHVIVSALRGTLPPLTGVPAVAAVVFITDLEPHPAVSSRVLHQLFGLTEREAQVALTLAAGHTVHDAARRLNMRYETARTHLRRVFDKTQTSRQSELATLVQQLSQVAFDPM